ncbi:hypothetical protein QYE76_023630 [Lolium multiflorum]|uniref:CCHC-type domain-containing protein n=1 Tax=Lolium multiflorum TaxID=4521 RepID=A0AAD8RAM0_LOLMU|nr:hypothetical protein QYE76_023630 [Lolium multiflorum]
MDLAAVPLLPSLGRRHLQLRRLALVLLHQTASAGEPSIAPIGRSPSSPAATVLAVPGHLRPRRRHTRAQGELAVLLATPSSPIASSTVPASRACPRRRRTSSPASLRRQLAGGAATKRLATSSCLISPSRAALSRAKSADCSSARAHNHGAPSINFNQFLEKEKLKNNGSNFTDWFGHVRIFLTGRSLQYVLDAPLGPPPPPAVSEDVKNVYETWVTRYSEVQCAILCSLEAELQKRFEHHDPCEMMRELKVIFETHAAVESYEASKQFFGCMMEDGSSVSEHVFAMSEHAKKLSDLGIVIPNQLGFHRVLQSLPPSYKNFVMNYNMQNMNKELPELFSMLKSAEVEIRKENQVLMVNKTISFKKQGKPNKGNFKKGGKKVAAPPEKPKAGPKPETVCYYCQGKGHWKRNCSKYLADLKSGHAKKKDCEVNYCYDSIDVYYSSYISMKDKTLLDTSCSGSFTRNKEEFKWDLLNRIQENAEDWENNKGEESGYADKPPFKPLPPKEGNEEKEEKKKKKKKKKKKEKKKKKKENKKKEVTAYPRVNEITLGNRKYVAPNDYCDNESEYDDLPMPFTYISDHDLNEHITFDIGNLFGTDYEIK